MYMIWFDHDQPKVFWATQTMQLPQDHLKSSGDKIGIPRKHRVLVSMLHCLGQTTYMKHCLMQQICSIHANCHSGSIQFTSRLKSVWHSPKNLSLKMPGPRSESWSLVSRTRQAGMFCFAILWPWHEVREDCGMDSLGGLLLYKVGLKLKIIKSKQIDANLSITLSLKHCLILFPLLIFERSRSIVALPKWVENPKLLSGCGWNLSSIPKGLHGTPQANGNL